MNKRKKYLVCYQIKGGGLMKQDFTTSVNIIKQVTRKLKNSYGYNRAHIYDNSGTTYLFSLERNRIIL